jgi:hypothetical protein
MQMARPQCDTPLVLFFSRLAGSNEVNALCGGEGTAVCSFCPGPWALPSYLRPLFVQGAKGIRQQCLPLCKLRGYQRFTVPYADLCAIYYVKFLTPSSGKFHLVRHHPKCTAYFYKESDTCRSVLHKY